jgi:hypothetical protein
MPRQQVRARIEIRLFSERSVARGNPNSVELDHRLLGRREVNTLLALDRYVATVLLRHECRS